MRYEVLVGRRGGSAGYRPGDRTVHVEAGSELDAGYQAGIQVAATDPLGRCRAWVVKAVRAEEPELPKMDSVHSPAEGWHLEPAERPDAGAWLTVTWPGGDRVRVRPGSMAHAIATGRLRPVGGELAVAEALGDVDRATASWPGDYAKACEQLTVMHELADAVRAEGCELAVAEALGDVDRATASWPGDYAKACEQLTVMHELADAVRAEGCELTREGLPGPAGPGTAGGGTLDNRATGRPGTRPAASHSVL